jgi:GntR family transcriptional regulator of vanillate catabolism
MPNERHFLALFVYIEGQSTRTQTMSTPLVSAPAEQESHSQVIKAQLQLREMILAGELPAGERIAELTVVQRLGISRTPVRAALMRLEQEGLLEAMAGGRGYRVRLFSEADVADAIELRGTLEGLAARWAAERGVAEPLLARAGRCLDAIDRVLQATEWGDEAFSRYVALNSEFHDLLHAMAASSVMQRELERVVRMPFALCAGAGRFAARPPQPAGGPGPAPPGAGRHCGARRRTRRGADEGALAHRAPQPARGHERARQPWRARRAADTRRLGPGR